MTQPEALRLADALEISSNHGMRREAATELRRLHAERTAADGVINDLAAKVRGLQTQRDALLEALKEIQDWTARATALRAALAERDNYAESASLLAQAVVLAEREKCAQLVETYEKAGNTMNAPEYVMVFKDCAAAIRARGRQ